MRYFFILIHFVSHHILHRQEGRNIPDTDDWYAIYHSRATLNEDRDHRVKCIDRMYFDDDGLIRPIQMTFEGVKKRTLLQK